MNPMAEIGEGNSRRLTDAVEAVPGRRYLGGQFDRRLLDSRPIDIKMASSLRNDGFFKTCSKEQATAPCFNRGPFVFVPGQKFDQRVINTSFIARQPSKASAAVWRCCAIQWATSRVRANFPRLCLIENTGTGTVLRTNAWRKALFVRNPSAALNSLPPTIGPWTASNSASKARESSVNSGVSLNSLVSQRGIG